MHVNNSTIDEKSHWRRRSCACMIAYADVCIAAVSWLIAKKNGRELTRDRFSTRSTGH
jgi:hypothetical protein